MSNSVIVFARMKKGEVSQIRKICELRGEDLSDFVRRSVKKELVSLGYSDSATSKALGVKTEAVVA